jgi:hypothetical protein
MAKATFTFSAPQKVTKEKAEQTAKTNDSKTSNFDINAETDEVLTLTGEIFEVTWTRSEEGKKDRTGVNLMAGAKGEHNQTVYISFGLFKSDNRLASGGEIINCKAIFSKRETQQQILAFCKKNAKVKVSRYLFFREGTDYETEITKVISAE